MDHMVYQDKNRLKSIFEGLDNIRAIVFGFYREKGSPSTLFESYKFTIKEKYYSYLISLTIEFRSRTLSPTLM